MRRLRADLIVSPGDRDSSASCPAGLGVESLFRRLSVQDLFSIAEEEPWRISAGGKLVFYSVTLIYAMSQALSLSLTSNYHIRLPNKWLSSNYLAGNNLALCLSLTLFIWNQKGLRAVWLIYSCLYERCCLVPAPWEGSTDRQLRCLTLKQDNSPRRRTQAAHELLASAQRPAPPPWLLLLTCPGPRTKQNRKVRKSRPEAKSRHFPGHRRGAGTRAGCVHELNSVLKVPV